MAIDLLKNVFPGSFHPSEPQLPDLSSPYGREAVAAMQHTDGYGALMPLVDAHLTTQPHDVDALVLKTECLLHLGRFVEARQSSLAAINLAPQRTDVRVLRALATLEDFTESLGGRPAGEALGGPLLPSDHKHPALLAVQAKDAYLRGDKTALQQANRAVACDPSNIWARLVQTEVTTQLLGPKAGRTPAKALEDLAPNSPWAMCCVLRSQIPDTLSSEQRELCLDGLSKMERMAPGSAWGALAGAHLGVCGLYSTSGYGGSPWPTNEGPMLSMAVAQAQAQARSGNADAGLAVLSRAAYNFTDTLSVHMAAAQLHSLKGDAPAAIASLEAAAKLAHGEQFLDLCLRLSVMHISQNDLQRSQQVLSQLLQASPNHEEALMLMAEVVLKQTPTQPGAADAPSEKADARCDHAALYAARALACEGALKAEAHYILGLTLPDMRLAAEHLQQAIDGFSADQTRRLKAQTTLVRRLVESDMFDEAQKVLDSVPEDRWNEYMGDADDSAQGMARFRARRMGDGAVAAARAAVTAGNGDRAIMLIEEVEGNLDIQHDAELYATLLGIKAMAYLKIELHSDARRAATRALEIARGNGIDKPISEARLVKRQLDEFAKRERKKWFFDLVNRYLWLIIGASGAGSVYTLGLNFLHLLRGAFLNINSRAASGATQVPQIPQGPQTLGDA